MVQARRTKITSVKAGETQIGWFVSVTSFLPLILLQLKFLAHRDSGSTEIQSSVAEKEAKCYGKAGAVAEEVLSSIRTVISFGGQNKEVERYEKNLFAAQKMGVRRGMVVGLGGGVAWFMIFASYSLAFWYGPKLILESRPELGGNGDYDAGVLIIVFFSVLMGAMNVGQASPYIEAFAVAKGVAGTLYEIIDRIPPIDSSSHHGRKPDTLQGRVQFKDVVFNYPSRPDVKILQGLNMSIEPGMRVALVGSSGCGKSTCIQLLQRFYDILSGEVYIDDHKVRDLNVGWLRDRIGIVGQEPVLFSTTIAENIAYGRDGVTQAEIEEAAKAANAHNFIMKLPKVKYKTMVGERGAQMSGGQKQRIAIARALVRNPRILLLDEATSALDTESEAVVQRALDAAGRGRTTLIVAHRLSTIRSADRIFVFDKGVIVEEGVHDSLMDEKGLYYQLVTAQTGDNDSRDEESIDDSESISKNGSPPNYEQAVRSHEKDGPRLDESLSKITAMSLTKKPHLRDSFREKHRERLESTRSEVEDHEEDKKLQISVWRIMKMNSPEWPYILVGVISAAAMGASMPVYAILFGDVLGTLSIAEPDEARAEGNYYAVLFLGVGVASGIAQFFMAYMFAIAGEKLTHRMRKVTFAAMMKQEMAWYDDVRHSTGALCARLSSDASSMQGATGSRMGTVTQSVTTIIMAIALSLYYSWKLGLVTMVFVPFLVICAFFEARIIHGQNILAKKSLENASKVAVEAISNIRTVAGLRREVTFHDMFMERMIKPHRQAQRRSHMRGMIFGMAQSIPFFAYAACMFYGGYLIRTEGLGYDDVFKVAEGLILGTMMVGQAMAFAPNYNQALISSARIFQLLDRVPDIDSTSKAGKTMARAKGDIKFQDVDFAYPTRSSVMVLKKLKLNALSGQTIALVGSSGCGKSTCIQLLERFYDPSQGQVCLDGENLRDLVIGSLRAQIGLVSQEPILFDRTIGENIAYGDNDRLVQYDEIIKAARQANIHDFIVSLPQGYDTRVGEKGAQLSGGQKQRVAIARALVRNPAVLLLDEATSALDSESEKNGNLCYKKIPSEPRRLVIVGRRTKKVKQVHHVLRDLRAQQGRTCITIAHRLSTIQNAARIFVFHQGQIVEQGTHAELMAQKGMYNHLYLQGSTAPVK
ncbi:unnamed protein product [Darwinula stevensoni]|uniref:ABC-type xenobiotic transporter n=1 Tax=Darwinula stevensoni TaxID=69355 RepID=A0A7R9A4F3_9CRUS|nr:unnamed protein product [Darwinula stevensoni]CAG0893493.1 unnamed protein product [Darwinula stevensoni]